MKIPSFFLLILPLALASCSNPEQELMEKARKNESAKQFVEAVQLYQQVIDKYPEGKSAPEAMYRMGTLYLNESKDHLKAAMTYELIADKYPKSEYAHKGLFIAGFTFANDLKNLEKAKIVYNKYLKMYPDSAMAGDARFELENLGKDPGDILESLTDSTKTNATPVPAS